jgi:hypothetical protein
MKTQQTLTIAWQTLLTLIQQALAVDPVTGQNIRGEALILMTTRYCGNLSKGDTQFLLLMP